EAEVHVGVEAEPELRDQPEQVLTGVEIATEQMAIDRGSRGPGELAENLRLRCHREQQRSRDQSGCPETLHVEPPCSIGTIASTHRRKSWKTGSSRNYDSPRILSETRRRKAIARAPTRENQAAGRP